MKKEHFGLTHLALFRYCNHDGHTNRIQLGAPCNFFAMVESGWAEFMTPTTHITLYPGELLHIPQGLVYTSVWHGTPGCYFYSLGFTFSHFGENARFALQKIEADRARARAISNEHFSQVLSPDSPLDSALLHLFFHCYFSVVDILTPGNPPKDTALLSPALHRIEANPAEDIDIPTLAKLCGVSTSGFYKAFKDLTGVTPITYKNTLRARLAVSLLSETALTVEEIATLVGCSSPSYLRKILAASLGKTPKEIRREYSLL